MLKKKKPSQVDVDPNDESQPPWIVLLLNLGRVLGLQVPKTECPMEIKFSGIPLA